VRGRGHAGERAFGTRCWTDTTAFATDNGGDAREQVAQVVGQVAVVTVDHPLVAEVAVGPEGRIPKEVVPEPVDTELRHEVRRRDLVEPGLAHLLATDEEEAVDVDVSRRIDTGGQQHRRPVHAGESEDVSADEAGRWL